MLCVCCAFVRLCVCMCVYVFVCVCVCVCVFVCVYQVDHTSIGLKMLFFGPLNFFCFCFTQ